MEKTMIIGLGDVLKGDFGVGCTILEKMAETVSGEDVAFAYLGRDARFASGYLLDANLTVITGALELSGTPGALHVWDQDVFYTHLHWMVEEFPVIHQLAQSLARARMGEGGAGRLVFIWIDPHITEGYGLSGMAQKAVVRAVWRIHQEIWKMRFNPSSRSCTDSRGQMSGDRSADPDGIQKIGPKALTLRLLT